MKIKESEKETRVLEFARELRRKLWNMRVTVILTVISTLGTVPNNLERRLEELESGGLIETIQTAKTVLLKPARILRRIMETRGDLQSFLLQ